MTFLQLLKSEFLRRACRNPRYSLRAFAHHLRVLFIGVDSVAGYVQRAEAHGARTLIPPQQL